MDEMNEKNNTDDDIIKEIDSLLSSSSPPPPSSNPPPPPPPPSSSSSTIDKNLFSVLGLLVLTKFTPYIEVCLFYIFLDHLHVVFNTLLLLLWMFVKGFMWLGKEKKKKTILEEARSSLRYSLVLNILVTVYLLSFVYHLLGKTYISLQMLLMVSIFHMVISVFSMSVNISVVYLHFVVLMLFPIMDPIYTGGASTAQRLTMTNLIFIIDVYFYKTMLKEPYSHWHLINILLPVWKSPLLLMYAYVFIYITYRIRTIYYGWSTVLRYIHKVKVHIGLDKGEEVMDDEGEEDEEEEEEEEEEGLEREEEEPIKQYDNSTKRREALVYSIPNERNKRPDPVFHTKTFQARTTPAFQTRRGYQHNSNSFTTSFPYSVPPFSSTLPAPISSSFDFPNPRRSGNPPSPIQRREYTAIPIQAKENPTVPVNKIKDIASIAQFFKI